MSDAKVTTTELSVLIPEYNHSCYEMVAALHRQLETAGIGYEIYVADDGTTDDDIIRSNVRINALPHCLYIITGHNIGRAAIRNLLLKVSHGQWLLFLDCDMEIPSDGFISDYLQYAAGNADVIDGGIRVGGNETLLGCNLRYLYEKRSEPRHRASERRKNPYHSFRTTNFMIRRSVAELIRFDERFRIYGYEDVIFGKQLASHRARILHIDNPTVLTDYEDNTAFLLKTEEAMRSLNLFHTELSGYSSLLSIIDRWRMVMPVISMCYRLLGPCMRRNLMGPHPILTYFNIYKLGYYLSLTN